MNSRDQILKAIQENKPGKKNLPVLPEQGVQAASQLSEFTKNLLLVGAEWMEENRIPSWPDFLKERYADYPVVVTTVPALQKKAIPAVDARRAPSELQNVGVAIIEGAFGVAENGAIWVDEEQLVHRVLPFITQHLIILLDKKQIVQDMHQAYELIQPQKQGFGLFIAGPSKTADIEQSLVKGAQGARSALIVLT
jgi:L-lactate dehydrogenase complex protein LldG